MRADAFSPLLFEELVHPAVKETASCQYIPKLHVRSSVFLGSLEGLLDSDSAEDEGMDVGGEGGGRSVGFWMGSLGFGAWTQGVQMQRVEPEQMKQEQMRVAYRGHRCCAWAQVQDGRKEGR